MVGLLNKIHSTPAHSSEIPLNCLVLAFDLFITVPPLLNSVRPILLSCRETCAALAALVPPNEFWRWRDMWCNSLRTAVFSAALVEYLASGTLITMLRVGETLGSKGSVPSFDVC
jgi:hypothetical protein